MLIIHLYFPILQLKEQVVLLPCSQEQQPAAPTRLDLQRQVEGGDILEGLYIAVAVPKVGYCEEEKKVSFENVCLQNELIHILFEFPFELSLL